MRIINVNIHILQILKNPIKIISLCFFIFIKILVPIFHLQHFDYTFFKKKLVCRKKEHDLQLWDKNNFTL